MSSELEIKRRFDLGNNDISITSTPYPGNPSYSYGFGGI